jgi:hypothetical protein
MSDHRASRDFVPERQLYLLRIWYEPTDERPVWRASVHSPDGAARRHFATRQALLEYLNECLETRSPTPTAGSTRQDDIDG